MDVPGCPSVACRQRGYRDQLTGLGPAYPCALTIPAGKLARVYRPRRPPRSCRGYIFRLSASDSSLYYTVYQLESAQILPIFWVRVRVFVAVQILPVLHGYLFKHVPYGKPTGQALHRCPVVVLQLERWRAPFVLGHYGIGRVGSPQQDYLLFIRTVSTNPI